MNPERDQKLEELTRRALRELPLRRAPRSLEQRVLAEIERRAALPWWRKSFVHWPLVARAAFVVVCIAILHLIVTGTMWAIGGFDAAQLRTAFATQLTWFEGVRTVVRAIGDCFEIIARNVPAGWIYASLASIAAMYAALFGLGAAAYRALYAPR